MQPHHCESDAICGIMIVDDLDQERVTKELWNRGKYIDVLKCYSVTSFTQIQYYILLWILNKIVFTIWLFHLAMNVDFWTFTKIQNIWMCV